MKTYEWDVPVRREFRTAVRVRAENASVAAIRVQYALKTLDGEDLGEYTLCGVPELVEGTGEEEA